MTEDNKRRPALRRAAFRVFIVGLCFAVWALFIYPKSPLSDAWNPFEPLVVTDPVTPLTQWKLSRALANGPSCRAALQTGAAAQQRPDFTERENCTILDQVALSRVGQSALTPLNTRCQTALRMAMWEQHGIQPAANRHFGKPVRRINHFSSYNCRVMRTTRSGAPRMSTHATAEAVDISGVVLSDGTQLSLLKHWDGTPAQQAFFRDLRNSACDWFRVTLGPDYNRLHADHFHLQHTGWGLCK